MCKRSPLSPFRISSPRDPRVLAATQNGGDGVGELAWDGTQRAVAEEEEEGQHDDD